MAEDDETNSVLREIDAEQIAAGAPILSVIVVPDDDPNGMNSVTRESVERYKLRQPGETDQAMLERLRSAAHEWAKTQ